MRRIEKKGRENGGFSFVWKFLGEKKRDYVDEQNGKVDFN